MIHPRPNVTLAALLCIGTAAPDAAAAQKAGTAASDGDSARIAPRMPLDHADFSIVTTDRVIALLVSGDALSLQLTDEGLEQVEDRVRQEMEPRSTVGWILTRMMEGGLGALLDHRVDYPLARIARADYTDGRLEITTIDGESYLEDTEYDGTPLLERFPEREARRFAERLDARARGSARGRD